VLQETTDRRDAQGFFKELKAVYGPSFKRTMPVGTEDGISLIIEPNLILKRLAEHFDKVWNQPSNDDDATM